MGYAYTADALIYDDNNETWVLRPDYDYTQHRVEISITDNDGYLDGDFTNGEVGDDADQIGTVNDMDGNLIASGQIYSELYYKLESPTGEISYINVMEIDGVVVGFIVTTPLVAGVSYDEIDRGNVHTAADDDDVGDTRLHYSELASVPCFCQGTTLMTDEGEQPVDWIRPGDRIMTRDHGFQRALWVGRSVISASKLKSTPNFRPVRIAAHSINAQTPARDLLLSPEHRVLLKSPQIEMLFGIDEAFAPIKSIEMGQKSRKPCLTTQFPITTSCLKTTRSCWPKGYGSRASSPARWHWRPCLQKIRRKFAGCSGQKPIPCKQRAYV